VNKFNKPHQSQDQSMKYSIDMVRGDLIAIVSMKQQSHRQNLHWHLTLSSSECFYNKKNMNKHISIYTKTNKHYDIHD